MYSCSVGVVELPKRALRPRLRRRAVAAPACNPARCRSRGASARWKPAARRFPPTGSARRWSRRRPRPARPAADQHAGLGRFPPLGNLLRGQGHHLRRADRGDRSGAAGAARRRFSAREEIRDIVNEIIAIKNIVMSISEQEELLDDICNDVLGFGPLEPLLSRDDIADIMVNGSGTVYIEVKGKIQKTGIRFRDNQQLLNICQRIVSQIGRRVDESSPICDARLPDGSPRQRHRAAAGDRRAGAHHPQIQEGQADARSAGQVRHHHRSRAPKSCASSAAAASTTLVSGGTGSGKTTLLNCLTQFIDDDERIITCEDAAELQLQQPHVVRLETRPPNLEGEGQVTMRDLVRNCLRMRPERIIVGEVRGPEAFDLLQAMNTGHDGSMGTLHANNPREALSRLESMITMGGFSLPSRTIREMITRLGRRGDPGRPPARRLAQDHPHHRGDGDGRRRHHHPGPVRLRHDRRGRATATSSAAIARPASAGRGSGIAPATTARKSVWPPRSTPRKPPPPQCGPEAGDQHADNRPVLPGLRRGRRRRLGFRLSDPIRRAQSRAAHGQRRQGGAGGARHARAAEIPPRRHRKHAQGVRRAPQEEQERPALGRASRRPA